MGRRQLKGRGQGEVRRRKERKRVKEGKRGEKEGEKEREKGGGRKRRKRGPVGENVRRLCLCLLLSKGPEGRKRGSTRSRSILRPFFVVGMTSSCSCFSSRTHREIAEDEQRVIGASCSPIKISRYYDSIGTSALQF